jgi:hypothetical protein
MLSISIWGRTTQTPKTEDYKKKSKPLIKKIKQKNPKKHCQYNS